jgi:hypothetical protein
MEVYADLELSGEPAALEAALGDIEANLKGGWRRSPLHEALLKSESRCFECEETPTRRAAALWLVPRNPGAWFVSNIVPANAGSLTENEYNRILDEFQSSFIQPVAARRQLTVTIGKAVQGPSDWMSPAAMDALNMFSRLANKSTGSAHPSDQKRWFAFLTQVHLDRRGPTASQLRRWLIETEGWEGEVATELAIEYESSLSLLKYYDASR